MTKTVSANFDDWSRDGLSYAILIAMQTPGVNLETVEKMLQTLAYKNGVEQKEHPDHQGLHGKENSCPWCDMEES